MRFTDRIAVVTGAGGPMGRAIVETLVAGGVSGVGLTDISGRRLQETVDALPASLPYVAVRADVCNAEEAKTFTTQTLQQFGHVDLLVNVVGGLRSKQLYTPLLEIDDAQWQATFDLNLKSLIHISRALVPGMLDRNWGRIVNISSIVFGGEVGQADYAAAKAAVASLTRSMAAEFAPHVTANCVAPGLTRTSVTENMPDKDIDRLTQMSMNKRMAEPSEIADAIAYFLTEEARFVTGEMLSVSGGIHPNL